MAHGKIWTADELLAMSPNERHRIVDGSIVTDIDAVPPELLERARADIEAHASAKAQAAASSET